MTINNQDVAVYEYLREIGIKYIPVPVQQDAITDGWKHDSWVAILGGTSFDYKMGTGNRIAVFTNADRQLLKEIKRITEFADQLPVTKELARNPKNGGRPFEVYKKAIPPTAASVIYSLLSDMNYGEYTFNEFCDELGYDSDSIKARNIYFACQDNGTKLMKIFSTEQLTHLKELLEDY